MRMRSHPTALVLAFAMLLIHSWTPATAIIIRHDRDAQQFQDLARRFPATAFIRSAGPAQQLRGTGTLIAPHWILTAAHVAAYTALSDVAEVSGTTSIIDRVILHPDWRTNADLKHDIALFHLKSPVTEVVPANLYTATDEAGMFVTFVGRGTIGTGLTGDTRKEDWRQRVAAIGRGSVGAGLIGDTGKEEWRLRAATNRVEKTDGPFLQFRFDAPEDANVTDLEGISGSGDSGGPAYLERSGTLYVIGVSSWQDTKPTNRQEGRYGVLEYYLRVSYFADWIRSRVEDR
jgi:hypothetical protein